ncbi:MAG: PAS domain-containing protein, partial [Defluviitaleaceae bacterium]|nr:PAS domain-containing protein [Defluviitaleaceae bacterium]
MQKRIYVNFLVLTLLCVLLLAASFSLLFFNAAQSQEMAAIRSKAYLMAEMLNQGIDNPPVETARITIIASDGLVLMDSHAAAELMGSRADRIEFKEALQDGSGESIRNSGILDGATFYYAIRLQDGNVLRLSRTLNSLGEVFTAIVPALVAVTAVVLVFAHIIARTLTRKIIKPLGAINLESSGNIQNEDFYEELLPYLGKISNQKQEIERQLTMLKNRADTIGAITANMQEGLILLDQNGLILAANNSVLKIFNINKESDIIQKNVSHICRDIEFCQAVAKCLKGAHLEMTLLRKGSIYNIHLNPVYNDDICRGAIIFFIDKTQQHKAENLRREFSANVSHELKTPLTTISALSEMMANGMAKPEDFVGFAAK